MLGRRIFWLVLTAAVGITLLYISRFWIFDLWRREGLFDVASLPPGGDLLARWLRGTPLAPFELVVWIVVSFLILTALQRVYDRFG